METNWIFYAVSYFSIMLVHLGTFLWLYKIEGRMSEGASYDSVLACLLLSIFWPLFWISFIVWMLGSELAHLIKNKKIQ